MKKTRLNKKKVAFAIILLIVIVAIIVTLVTCGIKYIIYLGSDEYKFKEIGYSEEQITTILKYATDNELEKIKNDMYIISSYLIDEPNYLNKVNKEYEKYKKTSKN